MKASPILTDDSARQWRYVDGNLYMIEPRRWAPEEIHQGPLYRLLSLLLTLGSKVRW